MAINVGYCSQFDENIILDEDYGALTIFANSDSPIIRTEDHACLAIEMVNPEGKITNFLLDCRALKGEYANNLVVLNSKYFIDVGRQATIGIRKVQEYRFTHSSDTWSLPIDTLKLVVQEVRNEIDHPEEYPQFFSGWGKDSIFSKFCQLFEVHSVFLKKMAEIDSPLFLKLCRRVVRCQDHGNIAKINKGYFYACKNDNSGIEVANNSIDEVWETKSFITPQNNKIYYRDSITQNRLEFIKQLYATSSCKADRNCLMDDRSYRERSFIRDVNKKVEIKLRFYERKIMGSELHMKKFFERIDRKTPVCDKNKDLRNELYRTSWPL